MGPAMAAAGLAHSPLALMLLDLARRQASGSVRLGGRRLVMRRGTVVDVTAASDDESLEEFLVRAGRVGPRDIDEARAAAGTGSIAAALVRAGQLSEDALYGVRRALWIDRLVRALARDTDAVFEPEAPGGADGSGMGLVTLILDALERRAAQGDAEAVGIRADHHFEWDPGPHDEVARAWSELDAADGARVSDLLASAPAAPSRIAALARAGLARLVPPEPAPEPPPRRVSLTPPAPPRSSRPGPDGTGSLPPPRGPLLILDPGAAPAPEPPADLAVAMWRPPAFTAPLDDPLDPVEREITSLEEAEAPGPERARAWRSLARVWQREHGSLEEAARAWREAAHADPTDRAALDEASLLCAAMGRVDLARSYAQAEVTVATPGPERARALRRLAEMALRTGDVRAAVGALQQATIDDPERAESAVWLVRLCRMLGDVDGAVRWAQAAAERLNERRPDRARALLAWAATLRPDAVELLEQYATALAADGFHEAAVSLLAEAARATPSPDERRRLLLDAAERAESAGRTDLAAERLLEAFDAEPHADVLHEPLIADLLAAGDAALTAVVLEEVAEVAMPEMRASWLVRAAEVHAGLPMGGEWAEELLTRALVLDPGSAEALEALRARARTQRDPAVLADGLERAARRAMIEGLPQATPLLRELAPFAEKEVGSIPRALWAWDCLTGLEAKDAKAASEAERLRGAMAVTADLLADAERELESAGTEARPLAARKLATALRDHPDDTARAIELYREAIAADPNDAVAASSLERLLRLRGDVSGLCELLRRRAEREAASPDRTRHLSLLAAFEWSQGHFRACADACVRLLDTDPQHMPAIARLERAGRRLDEDELRHRAIEARTAAATNPRIRSRAAVALALQLEQAGNIEAAIDAARRAALTDPRAADLSALLLRHLEWLRPEDALDTVTNARAAMGDSPPLLELATQVAERGKQAARAEELLDAWAAVMPGEPRVARWRLEIAMQGDDVRSILARAEDALAPDALDDQTAGLLRRAATRIEQLGAPAEAAQLAILATDRVGSLDPELLGLAERLAEASGRPVHAIAALERRVAHSTGKDRAEPLRRLAALHREQAHRAGEARALLRLLASLPYDADALQRLADLYAETGEVERLMAALALRLEGARDEEERRRAMLDLAAAAALAGHDLSKGEGFLRGSIEEAAEANREQARTTAAGALVTLGQPVRAVELLLDEATKAGKDEASRLCERAVAIAERAAEDASLALRTAARGLAVAPGSASLLVSFERLALSLGDVATARSTYEALAGRAMGPHGRRALRYREARWFERAGDLPAALRAYDEAFDLQPGAGVVFQSLERIAGELADWEPLVRACLTLAERTPNIDQRVALARRAAEHVDRDLHDLGRAFEILFGTWKQSGRMELLDPLRDLIRRWADQDEAAAGAGLDRIAAQLRTWAEQTWDANQKVSLLRAVSQLFAHDGRDMPAAMMVVDEITALAAEDDLNVSGVADALCDLAEWRAEAGDAQAAATHARRALTLAPSHLRARALSATLGPPLPPKTFTIPAPGSSPRKGRSDPREAQQLRLAEVRADPSRVPALHALLKAAEQTGARALADTVASILSMFDHAVPIPNEHALAGLGHTFEHVAEAVRGAQPPHIGLQALALVWKGAPHLFRRHLEDYGLTGADRIAATGPRPLSRALALATELLPPDGEVALFAHHAPHRLVHVVPTQPPSVAVPADAEPEAATLVFRVARGLELARPEHVLAAVLEPESRSTLLQAIAAAFGPPDAAGEVARPAAEVASELWRSLPAKTQSDLRELVTRAALPFDPNEVYLAVQTAAVRAGLAVAGSVPASVAGLMHDDPSLANTRIDTEGGYVAACAASPPLVQLLRFALSDAYLAARASLVT